MKNKEIENIIGDYKYGFKTEVKDVYSTGKGLNEDVVRAISKYKNEPEWMLKIRLNAYKKFCSMPQPSFGPNLDFIDFNDYTYYIKSSENVEKNGTMYQKKSKILLKSLVFLRLKEST